MFFNLPTLLTWARILAIPLVVGVFYLDIGDKFLDLFRSRRKAEQIEMNSANQRPPIRGRRRFQAVLDEPTQHESVDDVDWFKLRRTLIDARNRRTDQWTERPPSFVRRGLCRGCR